MDFLTDTLFSIGGFDLPVWAAIAAGAVVVVLMAATGQERTGSRDEGYGDWNDDGS